MSQMGDEQGTGSSPIPHTGREVSGLGGGAPSSGDVSRQEDASQQLYNPDGDSSALSGEQLQGEEEGTAGAAGGSGGGGSGDGAEGSSAENGADDEPPSKHNQRRAKKYRKIYSRLANSKNARRTGIAVLAGSGVGTLGLMAFLSLSPLKVTSMVNMLRDATSAASDDATSKMDDRLLENYIIKKVIPGMKGTCTSTLRDKSCAVVDPKSSNLVSQLYRTWRDNNLEGTLARDYGFEIKKVGNNFYVRSPQFNRDLDLGTYDPAKTREFEGRAFAQLDRTEARRAFKTGLNNTTFARQVHIKFSVGSLLERKYGIRRCLFWCKVTDKVSGSIDDNKNAFRRWFAERILQPKTEMERLALQCAFSGFDCAKPLPAGEDGQIRTQFETDLNTRLNEIKATYGDKTLKDLGKDADAIAEKGFTKYMIEKLAGETVANAADKAIPFIGWIAAFAAAIKAAAQAGPAITHMQYAMTSTSSVALASMYATSSSEQQLGHVDPNAVASMAASLDEHPGYDQNGASMEASNAWQMMANGSSVQTASLFDLFSPRVYAEGTSPNNSTGKRPQICDDGNPAPSNTVLCPEMIFGALSSVAQIVNGLSQGLNSPALKPLVQLATTINAIYKWLTGPLNWLIDKSHVDQAIADALGSIPGEQQVVQWIQDFIMKHLFLQQFTDKSSGARNFEGAFMGFTVMGQDECRYVLGCAVGTPQQASAVRQEIYAERQAEFDAKPLYARLFDKNDSKSLVSQLALAMPSTGSGVAAQFATFIGNPFQALSDSFASIFTTPKAKAAAMDPATMFGLPNYIYPVDNGVFNSDPEEYWQEHDCANPDMKKSWGDKATQIDPNTGETLQYTLQPCMLIANGVSDLGTVMNTSLSDSGSQGN